VGLCPARGGPHQQRGRCHHQSRHLLGLGECVIGCCDTLGCRCCLRHTHLPGGTTLTFACSLTQNTHTHTNSGRLFWSRGLHRLCAVVKVHDGQAAAAAVLPPVQLRVRAGWQQQQQPKQQQQAVAVLAVARTYHPTARHTQEEVYSSSVWECTHILQGAQVWPSRVYGVWRVLVWRVPVAPVALKLIVQCTCARPGTLATGVCVLSCSGSLLHMLA
jgi:hypothetical protein